METQDQHNDPSEMNNPIPKRNNFKIPEGYFEELASLLETDLEIKDESPKRGILKVLAINISIAAAVLVGVFLFNPDQKSLILEEVAKMDFPSAPVYVADYRLSMVSATEEWEPLEYYSIEMTDFSEKEVESEMIPTVEEVTADDIIDLFDDENYYELYN